MCLAVAWKFFILEFEVAPKPDKVCKRSRSRNGVFNDSHSMFDVSVCGEPDVTLSASRSAKKCNSQSLFFFFVLESNRKGSGVNSCHVYRLVDLRTSPPPGNHDFH